MKDEIERLQKLLAKATPGPWRTGLWGNGEHVPGLVHVFQDATETSIQDVMEEDAALIVAAVNTLPTLLATITALTAENTKLREALDSIWSFSLNAGPFGQTINETARAALEAENAELLRLNTCLQGRPLWGQQ